MAHPVAERALAYFDDLYAETPPVPFREGADILDQILAFSDFGEATVAIEEAGIPYFINEFWTARQRQGHSIHEVSYRACFKPQLPEFFITRLTSPGDLVHDPFMGRGTTPVQAGLMGRRAAAVDINPLSKVLTRPRFSPPSLMAIDQCLAAIDWHEKVDVRDDLLVFFHPETLRQITILRNWLLDVAPLDNGTPDPVADWIRMVAVNRLTGHSSGFFSVYTLPPNQAVSLSAQAKINEKRNQTPPPRNVRSIIMKKSRSLLRDKAKIPFPVPILLCGKADHTPQIEDSTVSLVVTSPPFLDIVQYADDNWMRCWFAGIDASTVSIDMHKSEFSWTQMVRDVLREQARMLKPGGHVAFEVGEVRGGKVLLERLVWKAAEGLPFERLGVVINEQEFTKTANCWGVTNNKGGTNTNRIVLLRRN